MFSNVSIVYNALVSQITLTRFNQNERCNKIFKGVVNFSTNIVAIFQNFQAITYCKSHWY